jgi:hypothetical protein
MLNKVCSFLSFFLSFFFPRYNQQLYAEVVESVLNRTEAPCGFIVDKDAELVLPGEFHVHGVNGTLAGQITGVHMLFVEEDGEIFYGFCPFFFLGSIIDIIIVE